jgi:vancomycin permeability regulator SanA
MTRSVARFIFYLLRAVLIFGLLALLVPRLVTMLFSLTRLYQVTTSPQMKVAIVFGAGLWRDGSPTPVLRDRVATAADLYFQGKVEKLLMSGDRKADDYNEPLAMKQYALSLGVPEEKIDLDHAGLRTYDTCYRAKAVFGVEQAILVTQRFHLPRALYTCRALGMSTVGVIADRRAYRPFSLFFWNLRELPATLAAFVDVHIIRPQPHLGRLVPIHPLKFQSGISWE